MKKIMRLLAACMALATVVACEPVEDRDSLPAKSVTSEDLDITVTQNTAGGNIITMQNNTPDVRPYWQYENAKGDLVGFSDKNQATATLPFAGTYNIFFTAFTRGGGVEAKPVVVNVMQNDENFFSAEEWGYLTNGIAGKTWVLDMASPVGWAGFDYPYNEEGPDFWNWFPDYAGNEWVMPNKNWGEMTFDLNGGYNVSVTQTALNDDSQTTRKGTFNYDVEKHTMVLNNGVEVLFGGDYYLDVSNWRTVNVVEVTENSLRLSVIRDKSRKNEDPCQIVFHFKPKP